MNRAVQAAEHFVSHAEKVSNVAQYGRGIIHDTYLVTMANGDERFILQRVNTRVFKNPAANMHNLRIVCDHIRERLRRDRGAIGSDWQMLHAMPTKDGRDFYVDADGAFWRALSFIREAAPLSRISSLDDAREVGRALGTFHWLVSDPAPGLLHDTLPGFHNVEHYLKQYDEAIAEGQGIEEGDGFCRQFIADRRRWAPVLEKSRRQNKLTVRVIHGDPKISNIMADRATGMAVSIIDLDTVMPGLVQYDIGDCLRSCCNTMDEDSAEHASVSFDLQRCEAVLSGYAGTACRFLSSADFDYLFDGIRLIPFELGLRFYTDFLKSNVYFKVSSPEQNLNRALVQFKLAESIELQEEKIRAIIAECNSVYGNIGA